ncbi:hypothetical protein BaRGS_00035685, partial [Batillaria attramentaria]
MSRLKLKEEADHTEVDIEDVVPEPTSFPPPAASSFPLIHPPLSSSPTFLLSQTPGLSRHFFCFEVWDLRHH